MFKSKAQMRKFAELVKQGKMKQSDYDEWLAKTPNVHALPERAPEAPSRKFLRGKK